MTPVPQEAAEAIDRLRRSKDGQVFAAYMKRAFTEAQNRLLQDDDPARVRAYQGEARALAALDVKWNPINPAA